MGNDLQSDRVGEITMVRQMISQPTVVNSEELLEHQASQQLRLRELLGAVFVAVWWQRSAGGLVRNMQNTARGFASRHITLYVARSNQVRPFSTEQDAASLRDYTRISTHGSPILTASLFPSAGLARLAGHVGSGGSGAEADAAMAALHRAVGMGYRLFIDDRTEDALGPLRDRPDSRLLMMDLAFPAEPFAKGR